MKIEDFVKLLKYKPKYITDQFKDDDVRMIEFRRCGNLTASIEFGTTYRKKEKGFYFYFEVLDLDGYEDMEFIPIDSSRRHDVLFCWPYSDEDYSKLASKVNAALKNMHKKRCNDGNC